MAKKNTFSDRQILDALRKSRGLVFVAARRIGCSPDTIYIRSKKSAKVAAEMARQRGLLIDLAESKLIRAVKAGEQWAVNTVLNNLAKDRGYGQQATRTLMVTLSAEELSNLSDEQLDTLEQRLAAGSH